MHNTRPRGSLGLKHRLKTSPRITITGKAGAPRILAHPVVQPDSKTTGGENIANHRQGGWPDTASDCAGARTLQRSQGVVYEPLEAQRALVQLAAGRGRLLPGAEALVGDV